MLRFLLIQLCLLLILSVQTQAKDSKVSYTTIEWVDLIPQADLDVLLNPPPSIANSNHDLENQSLGDLSDAIDKQIEQQMNWVNNTPTPEEQAYIAALQSTNIKQEFNLKRVRLAGFIVPLEYNDDQVISEFFLVPYFGACIHVPPPPPNQIIYVRYPKGLRIDALYDPFWVSGELFTSIVENDIATSAYSIQADIIAPYEEYDR
jgi:hypothetical protein